MVVMFPWDDDSRVILAGAAAVAGFMFKQRRDQDKQLAGLRRQASRTSNLSVKLSASRGAANAPAAPAAATT